MADNISAYLDYNATAPLKPEVIASMQAALSVPLNASSAHACGRQAKKIVEDTRRKLASYINCWPQEIIWCGSATEANNTILSQFREEKILVSAIEHSSVLKASATELIPVFNNGVVDIEWLKLRLVEADKPKLISIMAANNETGVIQPIKEICDLAHQHGVLVHSDAVQLFGKLPIDVSELGMDYMTLGFHKSGAPQGVGALFVANGRPFTSFLKGGGQEFNRRAGTENIAALAGLGAWLDLPDDYAYMQLLRSWLDKMEATLTPPPVGGELGGGRHLGEVLKGEQECPHPNPLPMGKKIVGKTAPRLPNTSCIILPNQSQEITLMQADLEGIMISAGSACSSGRIEASHVLTAMGFSKEEAGTAIRISAGWNTTEKDIEKLKSFLIKTRTKQVQPHGAHLFEHT